MGEATTSEVWILDCSAQHTMRTWSHRRSEVWPEVRSFWLVFFFHLIFVLFRLGCFLRDHRTQVENYFVCPLGEHSAMNFQLWDAVGIYLPRPAARSTETKIVYQGLPFTTIGRLATWEEFFLPRRRMSSCPSLIWLCPVTKQTLKGLRSTLKFWSWRCWMWSRYI